jgi:hypothetical protein
LRHGGLRHVAEFVLKGVKNLEGWAFQAKMGGDDLSCPLGVPRCGYRHFIPLRSCA